MRGTYTYLPVPSKLGSRPNRSSGRVIHVSRDDMPTNLYRYLGGKCQIQKWNWQTPLTRSTRVANGLNIASTSRNPFAHHQNELLTISIRRVTAIGRSHDTDRELGCFTGHRLPSQLRPPAWLILLAGRELMATTTEVLERARQIVDKSPTITAKPLASAQDRTSSLH